MAAVFPDLLLHVFDNIILLSCQGRFVLQTRTAKFLGSNFPVAFSLPLSGKRKIYLKYADKSIRNVFVNRCLFNADCPGSFLLLILVSTVAFFSVIALKDWGHMGFEHCAYN